jgi:APA family basic amino acid/polyamine antiporter
MVSVAGTLFAYLLASPRVYVAMANDGLFFKYFGEVSRRFGTPLRATLIQIVLACVLVLSGSFKEVLAYFFFVVILFVAVAVAGLFRIRRTSAAGYRTPLFPLPAVIYLALTVLVLVFVGMQNPQRSLIGIGVVSIGIPVYHLMFKGKYGLDKNDHV